MPKCQLLAIYFQSLCPNVICSYAICNFNRWIFSHSIFTLNLHNFWSQIADVIVQKNFIEFFLSFFFKKKYFLEKISTMSTDVNIDNVRLYYNCTGWKVTKNKSDLTPVIFGGFSPISPTLKPPKTAKI